MYSGIGSSLGLCGEDVVSQDLAWTFKRCVGVEAEVLRGGRSIHRHVEQRAGPNHCHPMLFLDAKVEIFAVLPRENRG